MNVTLKILLLLAYLYIFGVLLNYENAWMHNEVAVSTENILKEHSSWPDRLHQFLNWRNFEGEYGGIANSRARIFSNFFQTLNILLRNWLFGFIPPHPSFSLTWIVALGLCPYFLYKLMQNLTGDKKIGLISALLYLLTPGALIPIMMLFHPGKTFTNFFYIFCLYLGSEIIKDIKNESPSFRRKFTLLVLTAAASLFLDEYSLFIFVLIPIFYPQLFLQPKNQRFAITSYLFIPLLYYFAITLILPKLYTLAGFPGFDFFARVQANKQFPAIDPWAIVVNFFLLLHNHLLSGFDAYLKDPHINVQVTQFFSLTNHLVHGENIRLGLSLFNDVYLTWFQAIHHVLTFALVVVFGIGAFRKFAHIQDKKLLVYFGKSVLALFGFTVFFSLLHIANNILAGGGYYGSGFSVLFVIALGLGLKFILNSVRWKNILVYVFLVSLMVSSFYNVRMLNFAWMALHYREHYWELAMWLNQYPRREIYNKFAGDYNLKNNAEITREAWKNRHNPALFNMGLSGASPETYYFLRAEVPYLK